MIESEKQYHMRKVLLLPLKGEAEKEVAVIIGVKL
jgi:hypothetical protein